MVNGEEDVKMSDLAAYVEQSDALLGVLTVKETIRFAARLRSVGFPIIIIINLSLLSGIVGA